MAGYEKLRGEFGEASISVFAGAVDDEEKTAQVQADLGFPVAHGVTKEHADLLGAWWDERRGFIQPTELIVNGKGTVLSATYSTGPVGRLDANDALSLVRILESRRKKS